VALAPRGPGPFQILYRTKSMDAAAKWIVDHGLPPPVRGIRNSGEQAMLVGPGHALEGVRPPPGSGLLGTPGPSLNPRHPSC